MNLKTLAATILTLTLLGASPAPEPLTQEDMTRIYEAHRGLGADRLEPYGRRR